jgi:hypothetical protein
MSGEQDRGARLSDLRALESKLDTRVREQGETPRRHFDALAERIESLVKLVFHGHEHRLQNIEGHR